MAHPVVTTAAILLAGGSGAHAACGQQGVRRRRRTADDRLAPAGAGSLVRTPEHHTQPEIAVLAAFTSAPACDRKANHPPGPAARAEAARLTGASAEDVTVDLAVYERS